VKEELNAVILAHLYQSRKIQDRPDFCFPVEVWNCRPCAANPGGCDRLCRVAIHGGTGKFSARRRPTPSGLGKAGMFASPKDVPADASKHFGKRIRSRRDTYINRSRK